MIQKILNSRFTPFIILSGIFAILILYTLIIQEGGPEGWGYLASFYLGILIVIMMIADMLLWKFIKPENKKWVWIGELVSIILVVLYVRFS